LIIIIRNQVDTGIFKRNEISRSSR